MVFLIDAKHQTITAYSGAGNAARAGLRILGESAIPSSDPVKQLMKHPLYNDRFFINNLSAAFSVIAGTLDDGDPEEAANIAKKFERAVDDYYNQ